MFTCHRRYLILAMSVSEPRTLLTYSRIPQTLDDTPGKKSLVGGRPTVSINGAVWKGQQLTKLPQVCLYM